MKYNHSITDSVQRTMNLSIYCKIANMNEEIYDKRDVESIRQFLSDLNTVSTPDFVIRRHIQTHFPQLLADCQYQDLTHAGNVPWPELLINQVSNALFKICEKRRKSDPSNPNITKASWIQFLSGKRVPTRKLILRIAMTLQMDVDTTESLYLACNQNPYSARNPEDLIAYYCQHWPNMYQWADVQRLLHRYVEGIATAPTPATKSSPSTIIPGKTYVLSNEVEQLWNSNKSTQESEDNLIRFMWNNADQFAACTKNSRGEYNIKDLSSTTNRYYYMRFLQYLAVLYPTVQIILRQPADERRVKKGLIEAKKTERNIPVEEAVKVEINVNEAHIKRYTAYENTLALDKSAESSVQKSSVKLALQSAEYPANIPVKISADGLPVFLDLLNGMYQTVGWDFSAWQAESMKITSLNPCGDAYNSGDFIFIRNYYKHGSDILKKSDGAADAVSRRDILLLGYFFLRAIVEADENTRQKIAKLYEGRNLFQPDKGITGANFAQLVEPLDHTIKKIVCNLTTFSDDVGMFLTSFNDLLTCFHFIPLYVPSPFDRFVLLSLLTDESDPILSQLLLCSDANN